MLKSKKTRKLVRLDLSEATQQFELTVKFMDKKTRKLVRLDPR